VAEPFPRKLCDFFQEEHFAGKIASVWETPSTSCLLTELS